MGSRWSRGEGVAPWAVGIALLVAVAARSNVCPAALLCTHSGRSRAAPTRCVWDWMGACTSHLV
jgi:hypothetical protein